MNDINILSLKTCTKCHVPQDITNFCFSNKKKGYRRGDCKSCESKNRSKNKDKLRKQHKLWFKNNPDKTKEYERKKRIKHVDAIKARKKIYAFINKDKIQAAQSQYRKTHKEYFIKYMREYKKKRNLTDIGFRLRPVISRQISRAITNNGSKKNGSCLEYLPFTIQELKEYLEKNFEPWMNWKNWGKYDVKTWDDNNSSTWKWQIDHIVPHSLFKYTSNGRSGIQRLLGIIQSTTIVC